MARTTVRASVVIELAVDIKSPVFAQVVFYPNLEDASRQSGITVEKLQESLRPAIIKAASAKTRVSKNYLILTNTGVKSAIVIAARPAVFTLPE